MSRPLTPWPQVLRHFESADPQIKQVLDTLNVSDWFEDSNNQDYFQPLLRNIIYQQLAGRAADTIYARFVKVVGEPTVPNIMAVPDQSLRDAGLSWAKVKYVKDLAQQVGAGTVSLTDLDSLDNEAVIAELTRVKGIGRWTAEMFLLFTLHREDVFSYLDLGLKKGFAKLYGQPDPTLEDIEKVVKRWAPYQSYGSIALWHHLDNR